MTTLKKYLLCLMLITLNVAYSYAKYGDGMVSGKVLSLDGEPIDYATVF